MGNDTKSQISNAVGGGVIVLGVFGSFILGFNGYDWTMVIGGVISSVLLGLTFILIAHIIDYVVYNSSKINDLEEELKQIKRSVDLIHICVDDSATYTKYSVATRIRHEVYGKGKIIKVEEDTKTYVVSFEAYRDDKRVSFKDKMDLLE